MTTQKQRDANRRNAMKSTGPKTVEGRERSKSNALKHGLTAAQIIVFDEKAEDLEQFHQELIDELIPRGTLEEQLVERIAFCVWRLRRAYRIEAILFAPARTAVREPREPSAKMVKFLGLEEARKAMARMAALDPPPTDAPDIGAVFRTLAVDRGPLLQLSRYETTIERSLHRALHDLERLQARRRGERVMAPGVLDIHLTADHREPALISDD
jgi:hypothetical protein